MKNFFLVMLIIALAYLAGAITFGGFANIAYSYGAMFFAGLIAGNIAYKVDRNL